MAYDTYTTISHFSDHEYLLIIQDYSK